MARYTSKDDFLYISKRNNFFMKKGVSLGLAGIFLLFFFSSLALVSASSKDVGYILLSNRNVNPQITSVFNELNLTYDLLLDSKIRTYDLSKYRMLFIDDVRLTNTRNLAIYNYPSVVMNRYYGPNWGLTDRDGISQMTSSSLLNVKLVDNGFVQVYTDSRYSLGGSYIPIYYLSDQNRVSGTSIARAFEGGGDSFNVPIEYGNVIEGVPAGTLLKNNKFSKNNMCFYGIPKTGFWTSDARNLFLDCVSYVASRCSSDDDCASQNSGARYCMALNAPYNNSVYQNRQEFSCENPGLVNSMCVDDIVPVNIENCTDICINGACADVICMTDSDCDDADSKTLDKCENPATLFSHCTHTKINCFNDIDCGINGFTGSGFCSANNQNVLKNYLTFTCHEYGTINSYCTNSTAQIIIQNCTDTCSNGACRSITCYADSDCDDSDIGTEDKCLLPGTIDSSCENQPIACFDNSDCGSDKWIGDFLCVGKNLSRNYLNFMCNNPGTSSSFCFNSSSLLINQTCLDICTGTSCKNIECYADSDCDDSNVGTEDKCLLPGTINSYCTHEPITCFSNIDCGTNSLSNNFCSGNSVVKSFVNYTCNNPGTSSSFCFNLSGNYNIQTCAQQCQAGKCTVINCTRDLDCDDAEDRTIDSCVNPNTTASYCRNLEVNCLNNLDCGFSGFSGGEFCASNDVFKYYRNSTCVNPGTLNSNCVVSQFPILIQDCDDADLRTIDSCIDDNPAYCKHDLIGCYDNSDCSGGGLVNSYCVGKEVWNNVSSRLCLNPGTTSSSCSLEYNQVLNNTCSDYCSNGKCSSFICHNNLECGSDSFGNNYCYQDDVFKNKLSFLCSNPNTISSLCSNSSSQQLVEDCGEDSYSGYSANYCKNNSVYKNRTFYDRGCLLNSCSVNSLVQEEIVETCSDICVNGACEEITCHAVSDCGSSGWSGLPFCSGLNVNQNYLAVSCVNPGTVDSYCTNSSSGMKVGSCLFGCSNGGCTC